MLVNNYKLKQATAIMLSNWYSTGQVFKSITHPDFLHSFWINPTGLNSVIIEFSWLSCITVCGSVVNGKPDTGLLDRFGHFGRCFVSKVPNRFL